MRRITQPESDQFQACYLSNTILTKISAFGFIGVPLWWSFNLYYLYLYEKIYVICDHTWLQSDSFGRHFIKINFLNKK